MKTIRLLALAAVAAFAFGCGSSEPDDKLPYAKGAPSEGGPTPMTTPTSKEESAQKNPAPAAGAGGSSANTGEGMMQRQGARGGG